MRAMPGPMRLFPAAVAMVLTVAVSSASDAAIVRHADRSDATCGGRAPCYGSIQAAVNVAQPGDTVQVRAGVYVEQVSISGKNAGARSEASRIVDLKKRGDLYKQVQKLVVDDAPWIFVDNALQNAAGTKKVSGFKLHPSFYLFFDKISVAP